MTKSKSDKQQELPYGTRHQLDPYECVSAMQKYIRRGMEREAMDVACEMINTSQSACSWVCKRLQVISHEDIDVHADPRIVPFVRVACQQARELYEENDPGLARMVVGNAIRLMSRAKKSREGDHFQAAIGLANLLNRIPPPKIPDWTLDKHTRKGQHKGRGIEHFRTESAKLVPAPTSPDAYEEEAYKVWTYHAADAKEQLRFRKERALQENLDAIE